MGSLKRRGTHQALSGATAYQPHSPSSGSPSCTSVMGISPLHEVWQDRADNGAPTAARATASVKADVGPPPRAVNPSTRVQGHTPARSPSRPACSCGWLSGIHNGFQGIEEHLCTAWPVLVPRLPDELFDTWRRRITAQLDAATQERDHLWREYNLVGLHITAAKSRPPPRTTLSRTNLYKSSPGNSRRSTPPDNSASGLLSIIIK